jgi:DNA polymerase-4
VLRAGVAAARRRYAMAERARYILHADMDAFYASIEQRDRPELRGKPVIVGATSERGVVAAASYEARKFGVRSAMPGFRARALCPQGVFLPSNIGHYASVSAEVHEVFERFTPEIEPLALDEAFLDISGSIELFGGARALAQRLKAEVFERTRLTVSVGVAPNKLVAKIACTLGKPNGLRLVAPEEVRALLDPLPIRRLWGVGPVLGKRLEGLSIRTFADLRRYDPETLRRNLGERAPELQALSRGEDEREVVRDRAPKSYGEENTFETDVLDRERVSATLTAHAEAVARRLRRDGYRGRTLTLKAKLGRARGVRHSRDASADSEPDYPLVTRSQSRAEPTDDGEILRAMALALWDAANITEPVRLLGVSVSNLTHRDAEQLELFARPRDRLGPTLDAITERFGSGAIARAVDRPEKITHGRSLKRGEAKDPRKP